MLRNLREIVPNCYIFDEIKKVLQDINFCSVYLWMKRMFRTTKGVGYREGDSPKGKLIRGFQ